MLDDVKREYSGIAFVAADHKRELVEYEELLTSRPGTWEGDRPFPVATAMGDRSVAGQLVS